MGNRFVVVALGALACGTKTSPDTPPPEEIISRNPPAPEPVVEPAPAPEPVPETRAAGLLNGVDAEGRTIFRGADGGCYVNLPRKPPRPGAPVVSFIPPERQPTECPTSMKAKGWEECIGGALRAAETGSDCLCTVMGNPPPPPRTVACPQGDG